MSKVFSAKRKKVEIDYLLLDGKEVKLTVQSLSSKEQEDVANSIVSREESIIKRFKNIVRKQLILNDKKVVEKVIEEQYEDGDIVDFSNALASILREEKEKK